MRSRRVEATSRAESLLATMRLASPRHNSTVCAASPLFERGAGAVVNLTVGRVWRWYSAFACSEEGGESEQQRLCLAYKTGTLARRWQVHSTANADGLGFDPVPSSLAWPDLAWPEARFAHNLAILRLADGRYALVGGQQDFVSNASCVKERRSRSGLGANWSAVEPECLVEASDDDGSDRHHQRPGRAARAPPLRAVGVQLTLSTSASWRHAVANGWPTPRRILRGSDPPGCVDRRPEYTGWPHLRACGFDGRLSLVELPAAPLVHRSHNGVDDGMKGTGGRFRLYARSNPRFRVAVGGRWVQTSASPTLAAGSWQRWEPVRIAGLDESRSDLYFFHVQRHPLESMLVRGSGSVGGAVLLALFPLAQPPYACVGLAFSRDGVRWSRPLTLTDSRLGFRTHRKQLEWRGEDHPVAGAVHAPARGGGGGDGGAGGGQRRGGGRGHVLFYVHHAVKGMSLRDGAVAHVARYRMPAGQLSRLTKIGLSELDGQSNGE